MPRTVPVLPDGFGGTTLPCHIYMVQISQAEAVLAAYNAGTAGKTPLPSEFGHWRILLPGLLVNGEIYGQCSGAA